MKRWQDFLDSLSTKGGNLFMLFCCLVLVYVVLLHVVHDQRDATIVAAVHDMVIGFGGALLGGLNGNASRQQMQDRVETTRIPSVVNTAETVNVATEKKADV